MILLLLLWLRYYILPHTAPLLAWLHDYDTLMLLLLLSLLRLLADDIDIITHMAICYADIAILRHSHITLLGHINELAITPPVVAITLLAGYTTLAGVRRDDIIERQRYAGYMLLILAI